MKRVQLELINSEQRMIERKIKSAKFSAIKTLDSFDFKVIPCLNKFQVADLARCGWVEQHENVIALGRSGTGKTHIALGLGLAACQKGLTVRFITAAALVHELMEAQDKKRLLKLQSPSPRCRCLSLTNLALFPCPKPERSFCSS